MPDFVSLAIQASILATALYIAFKAKNMADQLQALRDAEASELVALSTFIQKVTDFMAKLPVMPDLQPDIDALTKEAADITAAIATVPGP